MSSEIANDITHLRVTVETHEEITNKTKIINLKVALHVSMDWLL